MNLSIKRQPRRKFKFKNRGFTLIEMLVVLALMGVLLIISIRPANKTTDNYQEKIFWQELQHAWNNQITTVTQQKSTGKVEFNQGKVIFYVNSYKNMVIKIPATLEIYRGYRFHINSTGQTNGGTVVFNSTDRQRRFYLVVQLGWGKYYVKQVN
ncbi:MAG: prepilin-type N-terminal cleavage/methylation domain-containing protein [Liquorilactobacillus nagelii]|uniref:prepilin-type N-terminal cleavage/methylation domain-containing protein n=1 Tax=Liquorilactobacillus nagelii TaxID=82688 RepID=UPI0039EB3FAF